MQKILIIEDNKEIADNLKLILEKNYTVTIKVDGYSGYDYARNTKLDAIILDIRLPNMDGFEILKELRSDKINTPILLLTDLSSVGSIENGFRYGADAYLSKPFNSRELIARLKGLLNRPPTTRKTLIKVGQIEIDENTMQVKSNNKIVNLRKKEFEILVYLAQNKNIVISRDQILNNLWAIYDEPMQSTVDAHISKIRTKLQLNGKDEIIKTIHGSGYMFVH